MEEMEQAYDTIWKVAAFIGFFGMVLCMSPIMGLFGSYRVLTITSGE